MKKTRIDRAANILVEAYRKYIAANAAYNQRLQADTANQDIIYAWKVNRNK